MLFLNYDTVPLLTLMLGVPWLGALFVGGIPAERCSNVKRCTLWIHAVVLLFVGTIYHQFDPTLVGCQLAEKVRWISRLGLHYDVALDDVAFVLVSCVALLAFVAVLCSQEVETTRYKMAMVFSLALEGGVLGCFCSNNVILLYLFIEMVFFSFLFFLNTSIRGHVTISPATALSLLSSLVIFLSLFKISHAGTHSLDVARYEPMVLPAKWLLCFLAAVLLRLRVLLQKVQQYASQAQPSKTVLILALGPVFLSQLLLIFRLRVLFVLPFSWLPFVIFPLLFASLLRLAKFLRQRQGAALEFFPLMARWTGYLVSLTCVVPEANVRAGLLLTATYSLGLAGLVLIPRATSTLQTQLLTGAAEMMILALLGAPCSGGFWAHMALLRHFLEQRHVVGCCLSLVLFMGSLLLGCFFGRDLVSRMEPLETSTVLAERFAKIFFWGCWGLLIFLVFSPLMGGAESVRPT